MARVSVCLVLAATLLFGVALAPVAAAPKQPTGERISLISGCWGDCTTPQPFPAGEAFYISHGNGVSKALGENPAVGKYDFTLEVDGVLVPADYTRVTSSGHGNHAVVSVYNFPDGMSGTHELTGHWWAPCDDINNACNGLPKNTVVEYLEMTLSANFE